MYLPLLMNSANPSMTEINLKATFIVKMHHPPQAFPAGRHGENSRTGVKEYTCHEGLAGGDAWYD